MTALVDQAARHRSHLQDRPGGATRQAGATRTERRLLGASLALIAAHTVDLAYRTTRPALATAIAVSVLLLAGVAFRAYATGGRITHTIIAGTAGLGALAVGVGISGIHAAIAGAGGADFTGVLLVPAGITVTGLAIRAGLRGRRRRWWLLVVPAALAYVQWVILPVGTAGFVASARHPDIPAAATLGIPGARDVTYPARDGVRLSGWYVPGQNHAAVILLHGSHGTRVDTIDHLRMLHRAGYAVLASDARGHGESHGQTNALGWNSDPDIAGAVAFLHRQPGIDPNRIAALGLSMGAEEALRASADGIPLRVIIADGAGASTMADQELIDHGPTQPIFLSATWLTMRATELATGEPEPAPLEQIVSRIHVPALLIASSAADERHVDATYRNRIGAQARLWYVPDASHTQALDTHPETYTHRVAAFLARALGP